MARANSPALNPLPIQDRPADPSLGRSLPAREEPTDRLYEVIGPREVGGKSKGEQVTLCLTDAAEHALIEAGHVKRIRELARPQLADEKGS